MSSEPLVFVFFNSLSSRPGFSILSGVEVLYFVTKLFLSLLAKKA